MHRSLLSISILLSMSTHSFADSICDQSMCEELIVVTNQPVTLDGVNVLDPKQPTQPLPAFDGATFLSSISGINLTRKGGASSEINFRGQSGSRINIFNDGEQMGGTCNGRMDPSTTYISPQEYSEVTVIKGPQAVRYGPMGSVGTVVFEKDHLGPDEDGVHGNASSVVGSYGRLDYYNETRFREGAVFGSIVVNGAQSDNFDDGNGRPVQSNYDNDQVEASIGLNPTEHSVIEYRYSKSSGEADFADREKKSSQLDNDGQSLFFSTEFTQQPISQIEARWYENTTDHIMDNFDDFTHMPPMSSMVKSTGYMGSMPMGMEPVRDNTGGYVWLDFGANTNTIQATIGMDWLDSQQTSRMASTLDEMLSKPYMDIMSTEQYGIFIEVSTALFDSWELYSGLRSDRWHQTMLSGKTGSARNEQYNHTLFSGFLRAETSWSNWSSSFGIGHSERPADYWEILQHDYNPDIEPESTNQFDWGISYSGTVDITANIYYGHIDDYILIDQNYIIQTRSVDAEIFGMEVGVNYQLNEFWSLTNNINFSRGNNLTDDNPLGQISPLENKLSVQYVNNNLSMGALWRLVAKQDRVAVGQGSITGQDLGETAGFGVLSINSAYQYKWAQFSTGIDNVFNKDYAEHISSSGAGNEALPINERTQRVNEPGRIFWLRVAIDY